MAKIAYILLCHKNPDAIIEQAERLTAAGDCIAIHFDARSGRRDFARIRTALAANPSVVFPPRRLRCGWGGWSLVRATLETIGAAMAAFDDATHFYMLSGDCMPIKSAEFAHAFLDADDADFIESVDFFKSGWIRTGMREERLIYRHYFNERTHKRLFYACCAVQKALGLRRAIPPDLRMQIGSQWWCLRRSTIAKVLDFADSRPDVIRFFRTTWIPDETFFQTIVRHLVPAGAIRSRTPTFLMFTDYGMPANFYNDHYDLLLAQDYLFARKISPGAHDLQRRLGQLYSARGVTFQISGEGPALFRFLTGRGRIGRRFATRFWEQGGTMGRDRELLIVVCKKWHVAKRVLARLRQAANIPAMEYVFNEEDAALPDLGGLQTTLAKRNRHRRALLRLLFDHFDSDRIVICMDPSDVDLILDFADDSAATRLLEIQCKFSDDYLAGHAVRVGLAGDSTTREALDRILPTIRNDFVHEADRMRGAGFQNHFHMREVGSVDENAEALAEFLSMSRNGAREIAASQNLFAD